MNSETNTDIFYKLNTSSQKRIEDSNNFTISSSLFTSSTPSKTNINISDSAYLNKKLMSLHKFVLDSDSMKNSDQTQQGAGSQNMTTDTRDIPINYSESTSISAITPYTSTKEESADNSYSSTSEGESSESVKKNKKKNSQKERKQKNSKKKQFGGKKKKGSVKTYKLKKGSKKDSKKNSKKKSR
jgi:hypothetical protein